MPTFSDLSRAAYCPRQLYYARRDEDRGPPAEVAETKSLAFRYPELLDADDPTLRELPVERSPEEYRRALARVAARDYWEGLVDPEAREVLLDGKDCRGIASKVLVEGSDADETAGGPFPTLVSPGAPPEQGVWEPQTVKAVAAAKALAWERRERVDRALVEYPAHAVVREVRLTTRRKAAYRRTLRAVRSLDGPPSRLRNSAKCETCEYVTECGVKTRSLRSLLGL
ncbi:hypothetical protein ACFO0N_03500 [Halobium salinum]|uniref:CRISPR-associated exonuclease Cas4 n=1 Tax=Halobium salinum TaxID=1364940 RepID=A0ABD5P7Z1_9EURY|nr:hypothetical protein [Halobium salinum]